MTDVANPATMIGIVPIVVILRMRICKSVLMSWGRFMDDRW